MKAMSDYQKHFAYAVLPDGSGGFTPCPELLTEAEAIRYLRLDVSPACKKPLNTLKYYREKGLLRPTKIGKALFYRRIELNNFMMKCTAGHGE